MEVKNICRILRSFGGIVTFVMIFSSATFGREDPFVPMVMPKDSIRPFYGESSVFNSADIELPSTARLIRKVEITYQNIDGSVETKSVPLRGRIDWRMPLKLTQILDSKAAKKVKPKPPKDNAESSDSSVESMDLTADSTKLSKTQDTKDNFGESSIKPQKPQDFTKSNIAESKKDFLLDDNKITIFYDGALLRDFIMKNPFRIVLDFKPSKKPFMRKNAQLDSGYFKKIRYGLHEGFIRVVVELNGEYVYKISKIDGGVVLNVE